MPAALKGVLVILCFVGAVAVPLAGHSYAEARPNQSRPRLIAIFGYLAAPMLLGAAGAVLRGKGAASAPETSAGSRAPRLAGAVLCGAAAIGLAVGVDRYKAEQARSGQDVPMAIGMGAYALAAVLLGLAVQIGRGATPPQQPPRA